jgi:hypothetical protein
MELSYTHRSLIYTAGGGILFGVAHLVHRADENRADKDNVIRSAPTTIGKYVAGALGLGLLLVGLRSISQSE